MPSRLPHPEQLLYLGDPYPQWHAKNSKKNRFFLLNIGEVVDRLGISPTNSDTRELFERASRSLEKEPVWSTDFGARSSLCSTHIYDGRADGRHGAKKFGQALSVIYTLDFASRLNGSAVDVYSYLRIIPAYYFVDKFDKAKLDQIEDYHSKLPGSDRDRMFGAGSAEKSFTALCLQSLGQASQADFLVHMAHGHTATKWLCEELSDFVNSHYPEKFLIGPVRTVGDEKTEHPGLGTRKAARSMNVPKFRYPLPPL